jgi:dTDP-L-rhamnose 4-epimerase
LGAEARALDSLNPQVHNSVERSIAEFPGRVLRGDVRDPDAVGAAIEGCTAIVHLAAETGVGQSMYEADRYQSVNVAGTLRVLEAAQRRGLPVLVASSRAVYGNGAFVCEEHGRRIGAPRCSRCVPSPSRENDPLCPVSVYGETKAEAEELAKSFAADGLPIMIVRPQNVIGAGQALHNPYTGVLAAFAARLRRGSPPQVYGSGAQTRDFIGVDDVAAAIIWLLDHVPTWSTHPVLNLGSGVRVTLLELALSACEAVGAPRQVEYIDVTRPGDIDHACADTALGRAIGLPAPETDFHANVQAFMDFAADEAPVDPSIWQHAIDELRVAGGQGTEESRTPDG